MSGRRRWGARIGVLVLLTAWTGAVSWITASMVAPDVDVVAEPRIGAVRVEVVRTALVETLVGRGTIIDGGETTFTPRGFDTDAVVTAVPVAIGQPVQAGGVVVEINARPVFVLAGPIQPYRDLRPGDEGPDVAQLQATLALAGVRIPEREAGVFGATTENGVRRMYRDAGYEPVLEPVEATADAPATTSLVLPQRELFALAVSPSTVVAYGVPLGERAEPGAVLITLSSGTPTITATLPAGVDPTASSVDLRAASDDGTWQASCRYAGPGGVPPVPDADTATTTPPAETAPGTPVVLTCDPAPDQAAVRQGVRVNAIVARSDGEVLAVPQSAVRALPDGTFEVEVARADGSRTVPVELGGEAGGMVEIRPAGGATVEAGDEVLATGSGP